MDAVEYAKESLIRPADFAYYGELYEEDGWGRAFGVHRDSDALERSNWEVISSWMAEAFPDDWDVEGSNHWAVGWVDEGRVRVLTDPALGITSENLTDAFLAVVVWKEKLDDYPVADESHWSELEFEEFQEDIVSWILPDIRSELYEYEDVLADEVMEDVAQMALEIVTENACRSDDISGRDIERAVAEAVEEFNDLRAAEYCTLPDQMRMEA